MTRSSSDWISLVLQNAYVGDRGDLRLQDFSDTRARIDWASKSEPHQVRVERFVLDPGLQKGRNSYWRTNNSSWVTSDVPAGLPKHWLPSLQGSSPSLKKANSVSPHSSAEVCAALGQSNQAFEWLNKACDQRDMSMISMKTNPTLDHLRTDPRFAGLMRRVGLP